MLSDGDVFNSNKPCNKRSIDAIHRSDFVVDNSSNCKIAILWHSHLGHPSQWILKYVFSKLNINGNPTLEFGPSVSMGNLTNYHFLPLSHTLQLVHVDVWGPSLVLSVEGYRYYICFVDDFIRFPWIFPMKLMFEAKEVFT